MTTILAGLAGGAVVMGLVLWTVQRAARWDDDCEEQQHLKNGEREKP
jgi:hypothetical protein